MNRLLHHPRRHSSFISSNIVASPPSLKPALVAATAPAVLLPELAELASNIANKQIDAFITRLADALLACSASMQDDPAEAERCFDAAHLLKKSRYPFYYLLAERLAAALRRETSAAGAPASPSALDTDCKLCLAKAGSLIENEHAGRLAALNMRLGRLLGNEGLATARNPFRPQIFLAAIDETWRAFHPDAAAHSLVFPLLGPKLCLDVGPILEALNAALIRRGILPALSPDAPPAQQETKASDGNDALARQLRRLFPAEEPAGDRPLADALPALFADEQLQATVSREQLLDYLARLQKDRPDPPELSLLAHARQWAPGDARTIDLLIPVFDTVFGNQAIPADIRALIGSLQIPVLKATLLDREFFFRPGHPVRRVIELLTQLGMGRGSGSGGAGDPLYQAVLRNVKRIRSDQRPPSFAAALADLESVLAAEEAAAGAALADTIPQALRQEKRLQAVKAARHEVALRIGTGEVVAFVEAFLEDKWTAVLTLAYSVQEEQPQAAAGALRTMDDLCWSVKPKITMEERKELLSRLPAIVAALNKWLDLIQWNDAARAAFFDDLARCHASIVRAPLEMSPERRVQIALAIAEKAAERRLLLQARRQREAAPDEFARAVERLECGSWIEFARSGKKVEKRRLAWISPLRCLFLFAGSERQEALSIPAEELAQTLRENRARIVLAAGLVEQALAQALAANGPGDERISAA